MKKRVIIYASMLMLFTQACNNGEKPVEVVTEVVTDTVTKNVEIPAEIDTIAIVAFYTAEHAKFKGTVSTKTKMKGTKKVSIDSDPIFASTDVMPAPATAIAPTPANPEFKVVHDIEMYYFIPDEKASFPGGEPAFDKYLHASLEYPEKALDAGVSRTVYATLFLDEQGKPIDVKFRYEPTIYGFQDEARRILMASPRWNPAKVGGKLVKSKFTIPITFKIN
jgi:hypothetical protein